MAKKTSAEKLSDDIQKILNDYENQVITGMDEAIKAVAGKARNAIRRNARAVTSKGKRKYSGGWMYQVDKTNNKYIAGAVIYQKKQPGLAHLLEFGHAKRGGGRTSPREHIKPVQEQVTQEITQEVSKRI